MSPVSAVALHSLYILITCGNAGPNIVWRDVGCQTFWGPGKWAGYAIFCASRARAVIDWKPCNWNTGKFLWVYFMKEIENILSFLSFFFFFSIHPRRSLFLGGLDTSSENTQSSTRTVESRGKKHFICVNWSLHQEAMVIKHSHVSMFGIITTTTSFWS